MIVEEDTNPSIMDIDIDIDNYDINPSPKMMDDIIYNNYYYIISKIVIIDNI